MAGIIFNNYKVSKALFTRNEIFNLSDTINLNTDFRCVINVENDQAIVMLECTIGNLSDTDSPFEVIVVLEGEFEFNAEESNDGYKFEDYLSPNAIAILFPYLRSVVSSLTGISNEFPALTLPVVNIAQMMEDKDLITINHVDS